MVKNNLTFIPLLGTYLIVVLVLAPSLVELSELGDERRYLRYAGNLAQGFFTEAQNPELRNGPGYPLVLMPFVALKISLLVPRLLNAFFVFAGVIYLYKTLSFYTKKKYALIFSYLVGLYPPLIRWMYALYSEPLAFMLICGLLFHFCKLYQDEKIYRKQVVFASLYLGFLVLTKIIFLQVMMLSLILLLGLLVFKRNSLIVKSTFIIFGGFVFVSPYLVHAYSLTGKLFYVGTGGGATLYHRSTPYENEWGNWFAAERVLGTDNQSKFYRDLSKLSANHREFYLQLEPLSHMERDSVFKAKAIENMMKHPKKYLKNTVSNIGRLLFHYPFSYRDQNLTAYGYLVPNMFIIVLWILSLYPAFLVRKEIPFEIRASLVFILIYAGGIVLLGGRGRNFIPMVPILVLFSVYVYTNILNISIVKLAKGKINA